VKKNEPQEPEKEGEIMNHEEQEIYKRKGNLQHLNKNKSKPKNKSPQFNNSTTTTTTVLEQQNPSNSHFFQFFLKLQQFLFFLLL